MKTIHITQGLDLRLAGAPDQNGVPENKDVWHVSITGGDYVGMKPTICVEEGDRVFAGQLLFFDKKNPGVKFVAPARASCRNSIAANDASFRVWISNSTPATTFF